MEENEIRRDDLYGITVGEKPLDKFLEDEEKDTKRKQSTEVLQAETKKGKNWFYHHPKVKYREKRERGSKVKHISPEEYKNQDPTKHSFDQCQTLTDFVLATLLTGKTFTCRAIWDFLDGSDHPKVEQMINVKTVNVKTIQNTIYRIKNSEFGKFIVTNRSTLQDQEHPNKKRIRVNVYSVIQEGLQLPFEEAQKLASKSTIKTKAQRQKEKEQRIREEEAKKLESQEVETQEEHASSPGAESESKIENLDLILKEIEIMKEKITRLEMTVLGCENKKEPTQNLHVSEDKIARKQPQPPTINIYYNYKQE